MGTPGNIIGLAHNMPSSHHPTVTQHQFERLKPFSLTHSTCCPKYTVCPSCKLMEPRTSCRYVHYMLQLTNCDGVYTINHHKNEKVTNMTLKTVRKANYAMSCGWKRSTSNTWLSPIVN